MLAADKKHEQFFGGTKLMTTISSQSVGLGVVDFGYELITGIGKGALGNGTGLGIPNRGKGASGPESTRSFLIPSLVILKSSVITWADPSSCHSGKIAIGTPCLN